MEVHSRRGRLLRDTRIDYPTHTQRLEPDSSAPTTANGREASPRLSVARTWELAGPGNCNASVGGERTSGYRCPKFLRPRARGGVNEVHWMFTKIRGYRRYGHTMQQSRIPASVLQFVASKGRGMSNDTPERVSGLMLRAEDRTTNRGDRQFIRFEQSTEEMLRI